MLKQSDIHRLWREALANWEMYQLIRQQKKEGSRGLYKVGIIGCGRVARRHVYGYLKNRKTIVVACVDPNEKQRLKFQKRFQIKNAYGNIEDLFKKEKLDLVSICTPPRFHAPAVIAAAQSGVKGILCEKPIGLDLQEADDMIHICAENQVLLATNHQRRFGEQHRLAKKLLREGVIGNIQLVQAECPRDILRAGIHAADIFLDYMGPVSEVVAASLANDQGGPAKTPREACLTAEAGDKNSTILVRFASGIPGIFQVANRNGLRAKLNFLGQEGTMEVYFDGGLRYRKNQDPSWTQPQLNLNPYLNEFHYAIRALIEAIEKQESPPITGEDGRKSLELVLAILQANQMGQSVTLPLHEARKRVLSNVTRLANS